MKTKIKKHLNNPEKLEQLFREDGAAFESGFEELYSAMEKTELSTFWKLRIDYGKTPALHKPTKPFDLLFLIAACLLTGFLIKMPELFKLNWDEIFYARNTGIIVFFGLSIYALWTNRMVQVKKILFFVGAFLLITLYVNLLPQRTDSDTINLIYIHLPLLMWSIYGLIFINLNLKDAEKRITFIIYNGDLAILMAILAITGGILTAITIGLFEAIGYNIEEFFLKNIIIVGAVSAPIVSSYIIKNYPSLTNKIAPIIARIFSPIVLLTALIYLIALIFSGKNPFCDRDFLIVFNLMLIGVMAIIVFSVAEASTNKKHKFNHMVLLLLSALTIIIDVVALSAIFYRLQTFGITPNRMAVLGSNVLILVNLILLLISLYKLNFKKAPIKNVELIIAKYLPFYLLWFLMVIFAFPLVFGL
ncbi:MAG: DUF4153 domain-containing protein [Bacteroidetes bacterium HGW-Bacteroidetes-4]|jgi:hypothetical protein|nr:MAG: DUF4153 domain-containing protein [Bacteroidetes bacterium HGW-Bacteroidetes-4]